MGCCFSGPKVAGATDADKPGAFKVKVRLSTGLEVPTYVLPSDTVFGIKRKVEAVYGRQPKVSVRGQLKPPEILIKFEGKWFLANPDVTAAQAKLNPKSEIKFQDIYDKIDRIKKLSHAHWFVSNAVAVAGS